MRSAYSRLNDNIGRRIRHLESKLSRENDKMMQWGYKENIQNLKNLRTEVQQAHKAGKDTVDFLYEKEIDMKSSGNLSTRDTDIRERKEKQMTDDERLERLWQKDGNSQMQELMDQYKKLEKKYVGVSGEEHDNAIMLADQLTDLRTRFGKFYTEDDAHRIDMMINNLLGATQETRRAYSEAQTTRERNQFKTLGILQNID